MRALSFQRTLKKSVGYRYLLHVPVEATYAPRKRWPLLLFLHGIGERGTSPWAVAKNGPPRLLAGRTKRRGAFRRHSDAAADLLAENFIVVSPQCPKGEVWDSDTLLALLDEVGAQHRVDPRRVYLTGLSMGGFGTWALAVRHPERFAAAAPVCGGGLPLGIVSLPPKRKAALRRLPFWVFHGAKDRIVPLAASEQMVGALTENGVRHVKFTVYPEACHDSWTETYANPRLYEWLLKRRSPRRPRGRPDHANPRLYEWLLKQRR
jgi:predicted peptidase